MYCSAALAAAVVTTCCGPTTDNAADYAMPTKFEASQSGSAISQRGKGVISPPARMPTSEQIRVAVSSPSSQLQKPPTIASRESTRLAKVLLPTSSSESMSDAASSCGFKLSEFQGRTTPVRAPSPLASDAVSDAGTDLTRGASIIEAVRARHSPANSTGLPDTTNHNTADHISDSVSGETRQVAKDETSTIAQPICRPELSSDQTDSTAPLNTVMDTDVHRSHHEPQAVVRAEGGTELRDSSRRGGNVISLLPSGTVLKLTGEIKDKRGCMWFSACTTTVASAIGCQESTYLTGWVRSADVLRCHDHGSVTYPGDSEMLERDFVFRCLSSDTELELWLDLVHTVFSPLQIPREYFGRHWSSDITASQCLHRYIYSFMF